MKNWKAYIIVIGLLPGLASCVFEEHVPEPLVADAEMRLSVSINADTRAGDPGTDHGEGEAEWKTLGVYLVYTSGQFQTFVFDKETFSSPQTFWVYQGEAEVYAVAIPEGYQLPECRTVEDVKNMRTENIVEMTDVSVKQHYMQNVFSGVSGTVPIVKGRTNVITVTCTRLAAKIDVQWDAQGAYADGKYTEAAMGDITLDGLAQGYMFPSKVAVSENEKTVNVDTYTSGDPISQRNGRTYFYTFPGVRNSINFTVDYTQGSGGVLAGEQTYKATFADVNKQNTWYKVNINVRGTQTSATGDNNHNLVLTTQSGK